MTSSFQDAEVKRARNLELFDEELRKLGQERRRLEDAAADVRANLVRISRAAHAAGMPERRIAKAAQVTPAAAHKWLVIE